mgnify:CR=1 FL=1
MRVRAAQDQPDKHPRCGCVGPELSAARHLVDAVRPEGELFIGLQRAGVDVHVMTYGHTPFADRFRAAGIRVIMVTGDQPATAAAIALGSLIARHRWPVQGSAASGSTDGGNSGRGRSHGSGRLDVGGLHGLCG